MNVWGFFLTAEQEEEEDRLHPVQRLCPDVVAEGKPWYETFNLMEVMELKSAREKKK